MTKNKKVSKSRNKKNAKPKIAQNPKVLTGEQLQARIFKAQEKINKLNFLERYVIFMGKVQLVEMTLKGMLIKQYSSTEEELEKCTLGAAIHKLEKKGLRADFVHILKELNQHRIDMAHEFLVNYAIMNSLMKDKPWRSSEKSLNYAMYEVEKVIQVYDFLAANKIL